MAKRRTKPPATTDVIKQAERVRSEAAQTRAQHEQVEKIVGRIKTKRRPR